MSAMDWVFTGLIALLAVRCFVRGFVAEVLSVAAYAVGLIAALLFYNTAARYLQALPWLSTASQPVRWVVAFVLCFLAGFLIMKLVERLIRGGLEAANLEMLDRLLGLGLGVAEGLAVVSLVLVIIDIQTFFDAGELLSQSRYAATILPLVGPAIDQAIRPAVRDFGNQLPVPGVAVPGKK